MVSALASVSPGTWGPVAAICISALSFLYTLSRGRVSTLSSIEQAQSNRIEDLCRQVDSLEDDLRDCERRNKALTRALADAKKRNGED